MRRIARTGPPAAPVARTAMPVTALAAPLPDAVTSRGPPRRLRVLASRIACRALMVRRSMLWCV
ncbi:MarR family transcriptional regulator, partial [Xanthomonas perforans]